jgi:hypothetical protein
MHWTVALVAPAQNGLPGKSWIILLSISWRKAARAPLWHASQELLNSAPASLGSAEPAKFLNCGPTSPASAPVIGHMSMYRGSDGCTAQVEAAEASHDLHSAYNRHDKDWKSYQTHMAVCKHKSRQTKS